MSINDIIAEDPWLFLLGSLAVGIATVVFVAVVIFAAGMGGGL